MVADKEEQLVLLDRTAEHTTELVALEVVVGRTSGNVLLRREQYRRADSPKQSADIARAIVTAKIANARAVLLRRVSPKSGVNVGIKPSPDA